MCIAIIWLHIWLRSWCMDYRKEARRVCADFLNPLKSCCGGPGYWIKVFRETVNVFNWRAITPVFLFLFCCLLILLLSILKNSAPNTRKLTLQKKYYYSLNLMLKLTHWWYKLQFRNINCEVVIETEIKERNAGANCHYKSNELKRYLQDISP